MTDRRAALALAALLALAGCSSTPPVRWHTLLPPPGEAAPAAATGADAPRLLLAALAVPAPADQPQWLVREPDGTLRLLEQERWAAPLRDEVRGALLERLALRWGVVDARAAAGATPPWRLGLDLTRFESVPGREARLEGRWTLQRGDAVALACRGVWREAADDGMPALAQAHRRALIALADSIGGALAALNAGAAPRCPA